MADIRWSERPYDGYAIRDSLEPDVDMLQVGPSTLGGEYLRRFWHPVAMSDQLQGKPVAIRILGEDLVIFRDLSGNIGLLHKHCAHRRASLEFGRIAENGIKCCYHGWHYDVDGSIIDTPGEPKQSTIRQKICQGAYPVKEFQGLIFAYMGPPEEKPAFPFLDSMQAPADDMVPYSVHSPNNWLQETENAIDPFHSVFLHGRISGAQFAGLEHFTELPVVTYFKRAEGFCYAHARRSDGLLMIRFHDYLMPNLAQNGGMYQTMDTPKVYGRTALTKWVVPVDDTNSRKFGWRHFYQNDRVEGQGDRAQVGWETVDFYGQTAHRPYEEKQDNPGDWEAWTSQGPMNVHQREYLGTSDEGVAMLRAKLRKEMRAVSKGKSIPVASGSVNKPFHTYGGDTILRIAVDPENDEALQRRIIQQVAEIYFAADVYETDQRGEYIRQQIAKRYPDAL
jgi:phenylpropionate dioxygenase-like ring-hydroxylating dioxygenase large terminal subunit